MVSTTQNPTSNIHYSSMYIIRLKCCSLIVDNTLSSVSVPKAPLGVSGPGSCAHLSLFFPFIFSCDPKAVCKAEKSSRDSLRWNGRLIEFNELFGHDADILCLFTRHSCMTLPICNLQPWVSLVRYHVAESVCVFVSGCDQKGAGWHS